MAANADKLQRELDSISSDYESNFAGQSRATRDLALMDKLLARTKALVEQVEVVPTSIRGPELEAIRNSARDMITMYQSERAAIARAKDAGPQIQSFGEQASTANFTFALYARHFAGQNRSTRDLGLLAEMVEDLKQVEKRMHAINKEKPSPDFGRDIDVVSTSLQQYQRELGEIGKAQAMGTPEERANLLGGLANSQFEIYAHHFAGKSRSTRRPGLLARVVDNLKRIKADMKKLHDGGFTEEFHVKNMGIVDEQVAAYDKELGEIRKARRETPMGDILGMLGGAANELFAEYREHFAGKDRTKVELARLSRLADGLNEIRRQMIELGNVEGSDSNDQNIEIVTQQLAMFEGEYEAIATAQRTQAAQDKGVSA